MKKIGYTGVLFLFLCLTACGTSYFQTVDATEEVDVSEDSDATDDVETAGTEIYVEIAGAVNNPGVYALPYDARVYELVEKAGGLTEDADTTDLNQAQKMEDGTKIVVYTVAEKEAYEQQSAVNSDGKININLATEEELQTLPGIGESKAQAIVDYREEHGAFSQIEDIMNIPGIKDGVFQKISEYITVN